VRISEPAKRLAAYPHEFSGGMRQRIMLASVMLLKPKLLVADEPTTALDMLSQRDVMEVMTDLARDEGVAVLLITHDLRLVARTPSAWWWWKRAGWWRRAKPPRFCGRRPIPIPASWSTPCRSSRRARRTGAAARPLLLSVEKRIALL